ncbi:hypothetical protein GZ212_15205 [Mangrovimonas sp. CR14]|uniref:hypothetical protein n=1 Tax=Mangrovimonas sp. CR14 TaxID=2706120 RepID=UPI0014228B98|nr:hypothetical protein [Mangrovimonas sp. CR14]NIK93509.1 hypothetical protein [Mangrovimonas sp. CR14]
MKQISILILISILHSSCNPNRLSSEEKKLKEEIQQKDQLILELKKQVENLENSQNSNYYRFLKTSQTEINVPEKLNKGEQILIDKKEFTDTLDISDNFFIYKHTSKIIQTSESKFEAILHDYDEEKSIFANDFFVRVMTFYNGQSLPLETENTKTDIHILIQPTELGYENKSFIISDFYHVKLKALEEENNRVKLLFEHGQFPRKNETIIIQPELVKFE